MGNILFLFDVPPEMVEWTYIFCERKKLPIVLWRLTFFLETYFYITWTKWFDAKAEKMGYLNNFYGTDVFLLLGKKAHEKESFVYNLQSTETLILLETAGGMPLEAIHMYAPISRRLIRVRSKLSPLCSVTETKKRSKSKNISPQVF